MTATALATAECEANTCGHVDTTVADHHAHGGMTPHDWAALVDAVQHALGLRTGPGNCYPCHCATEAEPEACGAVRPGTLGYQRCTLPTGHSGEHRSQDRHAWAATPRCDRCGSTSLTLCVQYGRRDQGLPQDPARRYVCGCGGTTVVTP